MSRTRHTKAFGISVDVKEDYGEETITYKLADSGHVIAIAKPCFMTGDIEVFVYNDKDEEIGNFTEEQPEDFDDPASLAVAMDKRFAEIALQMLGKKQAKPALPTMTPIRISDKEYIALEDGESYERQYGGEHEEGYSYTGCRYERIGDIIKLEVTTRARDCDGPLDTYADMQWTIGGKVTENGYPHWETIERSQRDHFAEMAGY